VGIGGRRPLSCSGPTAALPIQEARSSVDEDCQFGRACVAQHHPVFLCNVSDGCLCPLRRLLQSCQCWTRWLGNPIYSTAGGRQSRPVASTGLFASAEDVARAVQDDDATGSHVQLPPALVVEAAVPRRQTRNPGRVLAPDSHVRFGRTCQGWSSFRRPLDGLPASTQIEREPGHIRATRPGRQGSTGAK
jgi:hypothetical protein